MDKDGWRRGGKDMRYSRIRKKNSKKRYATVALIFLLTLTMIYLISAGSLGKVVSNLISLLLSEEDDNRPEDLNEMPELIIPDKKQEPDRLEKITDSLKANALNMYAIQMGAFTDEKNAKVLASELKDRGGAGYILKDDFYRVLAVGFQSEDDARKVKNELDSSGLEAHIYKLSTAGADMRITATEEYVEKISNAYSLWEEEYLSLEEIIIQLDSDVLSPIAAYDIIKTKKNRMADIKQELIEISGNQNNNFILSELISLYEKSCASLDKILSNEMSDKVAISSEIKYTNIEMFILYRDYMKQITN
jgi:hypothetical protein